MALTTNMTNMEEAINRFMNNVENLYDVGSDGNDGFSTEFQVYKSVMYLKKICMLF